MQPQAIADLARSGITPEQAESAGLFDVGDARTICRDFRPAPAIVIPYYEPDGVTLMHYHDGPFCRVRYLDSLNSLSGARQGFVPAKAQRYGQPARSGTRAYFAPVIDWQATLADPGEPRVITEGEKKGLAGCLAGFPVIALGGVFNFTNGGDELMPELAAAEWRGCDTYIVFDSDAQLNPQIMAAEARLVDELQRKRGARCYIVRLPQEGDDKVGLDDFLVRYGFEALCALMREAPALTSLDAKIVSLNRSVAWIERENMVWDLESRMFIPKDSFVTGSRFSALTHIVPGSKQRKEPKVVSVSRMWLTHPHAQRFAECLFRPDGGAVVEGDSGKPALNLWTGWEPARGDVTPFLELTAFLFQNMREHQDLPLKLMAYKAQNPAEKVPLATVLIGPQGCGKTMWGECIRDAFAPYGVDVTSRAFGGEFQGWLERSLIALVNEAEEGDMAQGADTLKALISDLKRQMNEKYRPARQIHTYTMYIITSNNRAVGAFAPDDRRMIVVDCPPKREAAFYERVSEWKRAGSAKALLGYLLGLDLKGWRPPPSAPMSAEKYMSYVESLTPVQRLAEDMKTANTQTITLWLDQAVEWARVAELSNSPSVAAMGRATVENVSHYQIRPWYTPEELTLMFPSIVAQTMGSRLRSTPAGLISRQLREAGIPYLLCADDPRGFMWRGMMRQYLVVADFADWRAPIRQKDFEREMGNWPTYGTLRARRKV